jgi:arabinogalactan oligomer/maltooligosaccharide transport system permease protein
VYQVNAFFASIKKYKLAYLYITPAFIVMGLVVIYPFFYNLTISFSNMNLLNFRDWVIVGFGQYINVFSDPIFYSTLLKTVLWTAVNLFFHVFVGVALALMLNRPLFLKPLFRVLLILPWAVPQVITALTWRGMFNNEFGAVNLILRSMGLGVVDWLSTPIGAFAACLITNIWLGFPFMMVIALGGLQSIPYELYEAADIDGASKWQRFKHITLPLLKPVMVPAITLGVIWTFNNFNVIWLVSNGGEPSDSTHILVSYVYKAVFTSYRYGYSAALSMVIFGILLLFGIRFINRSKGADAVY